LLQPNTLKARLSVKKGVQIYRYFVTIS